MIREASSLQLVAGRVISIHNKIFLVGSILPLYKLIYGRSDKYKIYKRWIINKYYKHAVGIKKSAASVLVYKLFMREWNVVV